MPRGYTVTTVALALGTPPKWVDNILSHHDIPGVSQSKQGIARRISFDASFELSLLHRLSDTLHVPVEVGIGGARSLATTGEWLVGNGFVLTVDREAALEELHARLEYAVEVAPLPKRGRPPVKAKRGA